MKTKMTKPKARETFIGINGWPKPLIGEALHGHWELFHRQTTRASGGRRWMDLSGHEQNAWNQLAERLRDMGGEEKGAKGT